MPLKAWRPWGLPWIHYAYATRYVRSLLMISDYLNFEPYSYLAGEVKRPGSVYHLPRDEAQADGARCRDGNADDYRLAWIGRWYLDLRRICAPTCRGTIWDKVSVDPADAADILKFPFLDKMLPC